MPLGMHGACCRQQIIPSRRPCMAATSISVADHAKAAATYSSATAAKAPGSCKQVAATLPICCLHSSVQPQTDPTWWHNEPQQLSSAPMSACVQPVAVEVSVSPAHFPSDALSWRACVWGLHLHRSSSGTPARACEEDKLSGNQLGPVQVCKGLLSLGGQSLHMTCNHPTSRTQTAELLTASTCLPQPTQVGLLQILQATLWHIWSQRVS